MERRKTRRFPVVVPVEVSWRGPNGMALKEDAVARQVNEELDLRLAREYRDAMSVTETLRRLRTSKPHGSDDRELLSALAADRIRRATSVCQDVIADLEAGNVP